MKHIAGEYTAQALTTTIASISAASATMGTLIPTAQDFMALAIALVGGVTAALISWFLTNEGVKNRVARVFSSIAFAMLPGPFLTIVFTAWLKIPQGYAPLNILAVSFVCGLIGVFVYDFIRGLFMAADSEANTLSGFIGKAFEIAFVALTKRK